MPKDLATLLRKHPKLLKVLRQNGVHFCAGCYLTLTAAPERAAAYHGVPNIPRFLREVRRVASPAPNRRHSPGRARHDSLGEKLRRRPSESARAPISKSPRRHPAGHRSRQVRSR